MSLHELTLDQLGSVARGRSRHRPRDAAFLYGGPYPFVQTGDVKRAGLYLRDYDQTYSDAGLAQSKLWPAGTLCITIAANIAETAILAIDACFPDSVIGFTVDPAKADTRFVKYLFDAVLKMRFRSFSQGAAQDNLSQEKLLSLKFPVPQLPAQKRIADILSAHDDLIDNNRKRIALLEEAARLLYREWFVHLRFPGHEHVRVVDGVPEGWQRRYLADAVTTQYGHTASAEDEPVGPKFLRGTDINKRTFIDWSTVPHCPEQGLDFDKYALHPGDILVIRMADPGKVALVENPVRAVFASYLVRLQVRDPEAISPLFLFQTLLDDRYQGFIRSASNGATRKTASAALLTDFHFVLPPRVLLSLYVEQVQPLRDMITKLVDQSTRAEEARDLLLPRLMNGEIAV
jgi:type I restriction enzyme S subunit